MEKNRNNDIYYFEICGKNLDLYNYISELKGNVNIKNDKKIIYIKKYNNKGSIYDLKIKTKKYYDYHIDYNDINVSDEGISELKQSFIRCFRNICYQL